MRRFIIAALMLATVTAASAWSRKGHQVVAYVAQRHLTSEVYSMTRDILNGDNIVYVASWLDTVGDDPRYSHTSTWHYINVDEDEDYEHRSSLLSPGLDAVQALEAMLEVLGDPEASDDDRDLALRAVVHIVGDLHQPLHAGHGSDYGGNTIYVNFIGDRIKLHSMFDYNIVEQAHYGWNYYDWAGAIDNLSATDEAAVTAGTIDDWARESVGVAAEVYDAFPYNHSVTAYEVTAWTPCIELQLLHAGLRLARLLNETLAPASSLPSPAVTDSDSAERVFTLQGVAVDSYSLKPGIYVTSRGRKLSVQVP